ncbi:MAG: glycosyltransferase [Acetatifactor sp.]|nr:glycosyltransferase [Acetatifactor sp.]
MNIALMTNNYKPFLGGVPISVERLANALRAEGHSVTVFAPTYEGQEEEAGVFRYSTLMKHFIGGVVLPNPFDKHIEEEFRRQSFDVIHVHHPMLIGQMAVYLARKYEIPLTFTYHTRYEEYLSYFKGIRAMEGWADKEKHLFGPLSEHILFLLKEVLIPRYMHGFMKHCDRIFAPTEGILEYLHNHCQIDYERLDILPTGIEECHFQVPEQEKEALRAKYNATDCPLLLSVSRMAHEKNVDFLIRSVALAKEKMLQKESFTPFRVLLVGDGPDRAKYEALRDQLHVTEEILFAGSVPNREIAAYYAAADAFLFASKTETQGIVILEAFAGATPVYAVDASGVRDLVKEGVNGRLFDEELEDFADGIIELVHKSEMLAGMAEGAYQTALQYREKTVARRAVSGYTYVCQHKKSSCGIMDAGLFMHRVANGI